MNDHEMTEERVGDLFHQVGAGLHPDVAHLVAAGVGRGARRRRRRRAGTAVAAAVAAAAVIVPGALVLGRDDPAPSDVSPADQGPREVVPAEDMTAVLLRLLPSSTPVEDDEPFTYGVQRGVVRWRGVRVSVSIDDRYLGSPTTASERCQTFNTRPCARAGDAGWLTGYGSIGAVTVDGGEPYADYVRLYEPTGYVVEATGERGDGQDVEEGRGSAADRDLLQRLVVDDAWFR